MRSIAQVVTGIFFSDIPLHPRNGSFLAASFSLWKKTGARESPLFPLPLLE